ncbi:SLATT domain-containing protein [Lentilactobacillus sp. SPB1-3]|uniref:SLATT domain-containing protein n=1 Tax=Lentilactobacillus terminaliae TaxID=3003483 RepID=A0ACD5DFJ0_9LACO|nr:SLATT domain-containing protein [Lentilactobacillus sp. SPB1-3]MCZ0976671.1 SLATT domain-containing protein [Lentilactobacillus sp. SPB1-3]
MISNRERVFNNTIDLLLSVSWTQKITAEHYDLLSKYSTWIKWIRIFSTLLTSTTVATLFASNNFKTKLAAIVGSILLTLLEIITNQFNIEKSMAKLSILKEELWNIKIDITGLARRLKCVSDDVKIDELEVGYNDLLNKVKSIQAEIPSAPKISIVNASRDIHERNDNDIWNDREKLLPRDILHFKEND